jgi:hypothetical protein
MGKVAKGMCRIVKTPDVRKMDLLSLIQWCREVLADTPVSKLVAGSFLKHEEFRQCSTSTLGNEIRAIEARPSLKGECKHCAVGTLLLADGIKAAKEFAAFIDDDYRSEGFAAQPAWVKLFCGISRAFEGRAGEMSDTGDYIPVKKALRKKDAIAYLDKMYDAINAGDGAESADPNWNSSEVQ